MNRNATTAIATALAVLVAVPGVASAAAQTPDPAAGPHERTIVAPPTGNYLWATWQADFTGGKILVGGDAAATSYRDIDGVSAGILGTTVTRVPLTGTEPVLRSRLVEPPVKGSQWVWEDGAVGIAGASWFAEATWSGGRARVRRVDAAGRTTSRRNVRGVPGDIVEQAIVVPTARGGRVVWGASKVVVTNLRGQKRSAAITGGFQSVVALRDGALLLDTGRPGRTLWRISPSGKTTKSVARAVPRGGTVLDVANVGGGAALAYRLKARGADRASSGVALLNGAGRKLRASSLDDVGVPWEAIGCAAQREREVTGVVAGPAGTPILSVGCWNSTVSGGTTGPPVRAAVELDRKLRFRQIVATGDGRVAAISPHGDVIVAHNDSYSAGVVTLRGALPVSRGRIVRRTRVASGRTLRLRIACDRPYGAVCSGVASARRGETTVAVPYAIPGRPGRARGELDIDLEFSRVVSRSMPVTRSPLGPLRETPHTEAVNAED